jgi:hypothetical protein
MADASEVMEEVITLLHESEAIVTALVVAGVDAARLQALSFAKRPATPANSESPAQKEAPLLPPPGCFSLALELAEPPAAPTSTALAAFGMLFKDTSRCRVKTPPCPAPSLVTVFTGLAQVYHFSFFVLRVKITSHRSLCAVPCST